MRLLAIDTASDACSAAVLDGERLFVRSEVVGRGHAERLFGQIEGALSDAGLSLAGLDRIAVTVGPGSFTGLRVGIAAARGLALATRLPTVGVSTLAVHAESARITAGKRPIAVAITAGRGELYGAVYAFGEDGTPGEAIPAEAASAQVFAARVHADTVLAGSGADLVIAALPMDLKPTVAHRNTVPEMAAFCRLGARLAPSATPPRPLYLRPPDAKPQDGARIARR